MKTKNFLFVFLWCLPSFLLARPEYALRHKAPCSSCHVRPQGGGIKTNMGRVHAYKGQWISSKYLDKNYAFDLRMLGNLDLPTRTNKKQSALKLNIMSVQLQVDLVTEDNFHTIVSYDGGRMGASGLGDAFLMWKPVDPIQGIYWSLGRTGIPFGLLTDGHYTYARHYSSTMYNRDFANLIMVSQNVLYSLHYDIGVTGIFEGEDLGELPYGAFFNVNWNPAYIPSFFGFSAVNHRSAAKEGKFPYAMSYYTGIDFAHMTNQVLKLNILLEGVFGRYFNRSNLGRVLPGDSAGYSKSVENSKSQVYSFQTKLDITRQLVLVYKFDRWIPDISYDDHLDRHSYGIDVALRPHMNLLLRYDQGSISRKPSFEEDGYGNRQMLTCVLHYWI